MGPPGPGPVLVGLTKIFFLIGAELPLFGMRVTYIQLSVRDKESGRIGIQQPLRFDAIRAVTAKLRNIFRGVRLESSQIGGRTEIVGHSSLARLLISQPFNCFVLSLIRHYILSL